MYLKARGRERWGDIGRHGTSSTPKGSGGGERNGAPSGHAASSREEGTVAIWDISIVRGGWGEGGREGEGMGGEGGKEGGGEGEEGGGEGEEGGGEGKEGK